MAWQGHYDATSGEGERMAEWESRVRDIPGVLRSAGRLLQHHWPALFTLALCGAALRSAAIWTAVTVSDTSGTDSDTKLPGVSKDDEKDAETFFTYVQKECADSITGGLTE